MKHAHESALRLGQTEQQAGQDVGWGAQDERGRGSGATAGRTCILAASIFALQIDLEALSQLQQPWELTLIENLLCATHGSKNFT